MKSYNVYVYFPASELEIRVQAESLEQAISTAETNGNKLLASGVTWNDSTKKPVRVIGAIELGELK